MAASAPPGSVALWVRKMVPPLGAPGDVVPSTAIIMFWTAVPTLVSVSFETVSERVVSRRGRQAGGGDRDRGHPGGHERPLTARAGGHGQAQHLGGHGGQFGVHVDVLLFGRRRREQPQPRRRRLGRRAPAVERDAGAVARGNVAEGDDRVEVVRLVILDELVRAEGAVGVAGGAQEDDRVVVSGDGEGLSESEERGDAGGVVVGPLGGQGRHVAVGEDHDGPLGASLGDRPDVLQRHGLAVDSGREAVDVRLEAHGAELLFDPDAHAVVRVGAGDALGVVLDDASRGRRRRRRRRTTGAPG